MLNQIAEGVYEVTSELRMAPGFYLPVRCTVLVIGEGELALVSPVRMSEETVREIDALGKVTHIVAPNLLHHIFLGAAMKQWPAARVHGAPGLAKKRGDLTFHEVLGAKEDALGADLACVLLEGAPDMNEVVILHKPSRTLVVTDLVFNLQAPHGALTWLFLNVMGTYKRLNVSRLVRFALRNRARVAPSLRRVLSLDFDRLVVAHGDVLDEGAKAKVTPLFSWVFGADAKELPLAT